MPDTSNSSASSRKHRSSHHAVASAGSGARRHAAPGRPKKAAAPAGAGFAAALSLVAALLGGIASASSADAAEAPRVVASIKPVDSLVSAVMAGVGEPYLIVKGAASPHTAALKPSDATALSNAQAIFWIGPELENFLIKPIGSLGAKDAVVELWDAPGVEKLKARSGVMFEPDDDGPVDDDAAHDDHAHGDHAHGDNPYNEHVWLDPENAIAMTKTIAVTLERVDPANAETYRNNAAAYENRLKKLETKVRDELKGLHKKPYVVFHDAYQYFEHRFDVPAAGAITVSPEKAPGAARIREIKSKLESVGASCVFTEPEFEPSIVRTVTEGTSAKIGVLDPLGADLKDGPDLYPTLIENIAKGLEECFAQS
ncbi:zinc ABC transporter substrate-binding protein [Jiella mangrovi]|uniref:High-affinity zinc uptake system protein ZnuA n=1 Tax=Jiella mangrovi TaxID=2821407 RepID=A0ABS4BEA0_9HYPH|nr:zinc ABC transporter substrate-binding protein [Jiella mangrovi]MBP0615075.1 zinc ABC transporter substrate-binding protein [Jiella mangrovi]